MDTYSAITIVRTLMDGFDPLTGEQLPGSSPYSHPQVIRALLTLVECVVQPKRKKSVPERQAENIAKGLPRNTGLPWQEGARASVAAAFREGVPIEQLAEEQSRSRIAIAAELKRQGLISAEEAARLGLVRPH